MTSLTSQLAYLGVLGCPRLSIDICIIAFDMYWCNFNCGGGYISFCVQLCNTLRGTMTVRLHGKCWCFGVFTVEYFSDEQDNRLKPGCGKSMPATNLSWIIYIMWLYMITYNHYIKTEWLIYAWVQHTSIASDNALSPGRSQSIIWTNAGILSIGPFSTNFIDILIESHTFHSRKRIWKCCLGNGVHFVWVSMC